MKGTYENICYGILVDYIFRLHILLHFKGFQAYWISPFQFDNLVRAQICLLLDQPKNKSQRSP